MDSKQACRPPSSRATPCRASLVKRGWIARVTLLPTSQRRVPTATTLLLRRCGTAPPAALLFGSIPAPASPCHPCWVQPVHLNARGDGATRRRARLALRFTSTRVEAAVLPQLSGQHGHGSLPRAWRRPTRARGGQTPAPDHLHARGDDACSLAYLVPSCGSPPRAWRRPQQASNRKRVQRFTSTRVETNPILAGQRTGIPVHLHARRDDDSGRA